MSDTPTLEKAAREFRSVALLAIASGYERHREAVIAAESALDTALAAEPERREAVRELVEALEKAYATFVDTHKTLKLLQHPIAAKAMLIAADATEATLAHCRELGI